MKLEYKGFWLSVKPIYGDIRYVCEIVNIENFDYKYNQAKCFDIGYFCATNEVDLEDKFKKTVEALRTLGISYKELDTSIENESNALYERITKDLKN